MSCLLPPAKASIGLGYTGVFVTPTADIQNFGVITLGASNFLTPYFINKNHSEEREAEHYFIGLGVFPNLEIFGGLTEVHRKGADPNKYGDFDTRDLVGNVKWQFFSIDNTRFALGVNDVAGLAVNERRYYGVVSHDFSGFDMSVGYSKLPEQTRNQEMFEGIFASAQVTIPYGISLYAEHDGHNFRQGLGGSWKHNGSGVQFDAKAIVNSDLHNEESSFYVGIQVPLIRDSGTRLIKDIDLQKANLPTNLQASDRSELSRQTKHEISTDSKSCSYGYALSEQQVKQLSSKLYNQGLGNVDVSCNNEKLLLSFSNRLFVSGEPEAFIVASQVLQEYLISISHTGLISMRINSARTWDIGAELSMSSDQLKLLDINYLEKSNSFDTSIMSLDGSHNELIDISVLPVYRANYGSEVGVLDTSIGARLDIKAQPWRNAWLNYKHDIPLYNSHHYQKGGFFEDRALDAGIHEISLSQRWYVNSLASVELIGGFRGIGGNDYSFQGGTGTMHDPSGVHSVYTKAAVYQPVDGDLINRQVIAGGYRWLSPENNLALSYEGGEYFYGDLTDKIKAEFFLDKSSFETSFTKSASGWAKIGAVLRVPFGPDKKYPFNRVTLGGAPVWSPSIYTTVDNPFAPSANLAAGTAVYVDTGVTPAAGISKARTAEFGGRWSPAYLRELFNRMIVY